ncbi:MAG: Allergen V5/Tpx-1 family protein [candidate division TM6 bacterium GW2011_GWE2_42_60]|nr:MAG: Allergen V5/Tpx-1 family protein [candidate division TM6 bacterium GW2011_GWE2_42_60]HBY06076.1 hypothetical protein [Candidatus Dependentiae bacterium]
MIKKVVFGLFMAGLVPLACWASLPSAENNGPKMEGMEGMEGMEVMEVFARALEKVVQVPAKPKPQVSTRPQITPKQEKPKNVPSSYPKPPISHKPEKPQNAPQIAPKPTLREARLEALVHAKINEVRTKYKLGVLQWNDTLASIARLHSQDMANRHYFSHDTLPDLTSANPLKRNPPVGFAWRYKAGGFHEKIEINKTIEKFPDGGSQTKIEYGTGAENIFELQFWSGSPNLDEIAEEVVVGWMNSEGHKENILTPYWIREGIGVASRQGENFEEIYVTQDFC